jgi:hypothetical protein
MPAFCAFGGVHADLEHGACSGQPQLLDAGQPPAAAAPYQPCAGARYQPRAVRGLGLGLGSTRAINPAQARSLALSHMHIRLMHKMRMCCQHNVTDL